MRKHAEHFSFEGKVESFRALGKFGENNRQGYSTHCKLKRLTVILREKVALSDSRDISAATSGYYKPHTVTYSVGRCDLLNDSLNQIPTRESNPGSDLANNGLLPNSNG